MGVQTPGELKWQVRSTNGVFSAGPTLAANGRVYATGYPDLYAWDAAVQWTTDLRAWNSLGTFSNSSGKLTINDLAATNNQRRFYRIAVRRRRIADSKVVGMN